MGNTIIEKILIAASGNKDLKPGDYVDANVDISCCRDAEGEEVVGALSKAGLGVKNPESVCFTFDAFGYTDSADNKGRQMCRDFSRKYGVSVIDIDRGNGLKNIIDNGLVKPGGIVVSSDPRTNVVGALGAFGQGMSSVDVAGAFAKSQIWFKVPETIKLVLRGVLPEGLSVYDILFNIIERYGKYTFVGHVVEFYGSVVDEFSVDDCLTLAALARELNVLSVIIPANRYVKSYYSRQSVESGFVYADKKAKYSSEIVLDCSGFKRRVLQNTGVVKALGLEQKKRIRIDSAFVGGAAGAGIKDIACLASVMKGKKVSKDVVMKVVPATKSVWEKAVEDGFVAVLKKAGVIIPDSEYNPVSEAVTNLGQVTLCSIGSDMADDRLEYKEYVASPDIIAASAVEGYICESVGEIVSEEIEVKPEGYERPIIIKGKIKYLKRDKVGVDKIYNKRYFSIKEPLEMAQFAFDGIKGFEDFASDIEQGDIILSGSDFGSGRRRQQAVDCIKGLGVSLVIAKSFGNAYERDAINSALPIMVNNTKCETHVKHNDMVTVNLLTGLVRNESTGKEFCIKPFSDVQMDIYQRGGLLNYED
ncbi:MAG: aconitase family protein [Bacteroidales bacterium]|jgi:3-isopropylmalate dehydratase small subunit|nr:aconitase family protein [Bacteroidales bacterium]